MDANNSDSKTHPAGKKKANPWGLYDMHGNVWEWCQDWYDSKYYGTSPRDDPKGPESGSFRVFRGGCWGASARGCRSAYRVGRTPEDRDDALGLRVSRVAGEQEEK